MKVRQRGRGKENERHTVKYKYERCASSSMLSKYHRFSLGFIALDLSTSFCLHTLLIRCFRAQNIP